ncbi:hypothetical protein BC835DRAFT_989575 [Cytidiella melzeri]|nr:hypothetical protein BC835DRAFT_989575 [Cytidiella melzeri]
MSLLEVEVHCPRFPLSMRALVPIRNMLLPKDAVRRTRTNLSRIRFAHQFAGNLLAPWASQHMRRSAMPHISQSHADADGVSDSSESQLRCATGRYCYCVLSVRVGRVSTCRWVQTLAGGVGRDLGRKGGFSGSRNGGLRFSLSVMITDRSKHLASELLGTLR